MKGNTPSEPGAEELMPVTEKAVSEVSCQHFAADQRMDPTQESIKRYVIEGIPGRENGDFLKQVGSCIGKFLQGKTKALDNLIRNSSCLPKGD